MKKKILLILIVFPLITLGQLKKISLEEAINLAQKKSPDYKALLNKNQSNYWRFREYQASFLPQLQLSTTLPNYSNSINRLTNDNGEDIFVKSNQAIFDGNLSLSQNMVYTGGKISVNSSIERIDRFGTNALTGYSVIPFSIRYYQNSLLYNEFKWNKKIEPLIYEESKRDFVESMEQISLNTCKRYFGLLKAQMQLDIAKKNLSNQDTLFQIAKGRFKMGKIAENDLLQMELALLNSVNNVTSNTISLKKTSQDLSRYLEINTEEIVLEIPKNLKNFTISTEKALEEAKSNRKAVIEFRRRRLQAEKQVAQVKGNNRIQLSLNANFGVSRQGEDLNNIFSDYNQQQKVSLKLRVPLLDWGLTKSKRKMSEANLDLTNTYIEQEEQAFEQEIYLHTLNWKNQDNFLQTSYKAKEIANKRYEITKKRYILGKITITDLNLAQQEKDQSFVRYLNSLEKFWNDYYTVRKLTLFDFKTNKKITTKEILYK